MTAVTKYTRLESSGLWRETYRDEFIEVLISFGKTSIVLSDYQDNPITHWSLPAVKLVSKDQGEATFSTDFENGERLRVNDPNMINALLLFINQEDGYQKKNRISLYFFLLLIIILLSTIILYFPSKLQELTLSIISEEHERQLVEPFLKNHIKASGGVCYSSKTEKILYNVLKLITKNENIISISIIRNQKMNILHLPSGKILISNAFIRNFTNPKVLIALLERELAKARDREPLKTLINQQTTLELSKFVLGYNSQLSVKSINDFLRPSPKAKINKLNFIDDFSWVALQNICLN